VTVQALNRPLGFFVALNFDESEPARLPGKSIANQGDCCRSNAGLRK
jgi:hypothetical protein